ncbi:MAG TPA: EAL domain-containing protein [Burkholderiaceae bacterium]|nr:EAL domain-containing protein [Burkholderiaceae bacterium]
MTSHVRPPSDSAAESVDARATGNAMRTLLLLSHDLYWETDAQACVTCLEGAALDPEEISGVLGQPLWQWADVHISASAVAVLRQAMEQQQVLRDMELARVTRDASVQWLQLTGQPRHNANGVFEGYRGVGRDITQQKTSQQALIDQQSLLRELTRRVPGLLFQLRKNPRGWFSFPYASAAMQDLFEVAPEEARHDAGPVFARVFPVDYVQSRAALELSEETLTPWTQNYRVRLPDGRVLWHAANAVPYRQPDGGMVWYGFTTDITERVEADERLRRAHEQLRARTNLMDTTLESLSQGVMMISTEGRVTYYNKRLLELLDMPDSLLARQPTHQELVDWQFEHGHLGPERPRDLASRWGEYLADEGRMASPLEYVRTTHDGRVLDVKTRQLDSGGWVRTFADVTEHFKAREALERSELHLRTLFDAIPDRVWFKNPEGVFVMCNPATAQGYGRSVEQIVGRTETDLGEDPAVVASYRDTDLRALRSQAPVMYEQVLPKAGNPEDTAVFEVVKRAVFDHRGQVYGVLGMARDVTGRKQAEAQIERLAFYDPLTGLCNRRLFHDRLDQAQAASMRSQQWGAVCFIDLDNFKDLNDTQGHDQGDLLLKQVAQRLLGAVREQDTVARLGGDEFVVLLEDLGFDEAQAAMYANGVGEKLLEVLNRSYELQRGEHHNTPSIGITLFREHHERIEDVLKRADVAMYQSKSAGRNAVRFFDPDMQAAVQRRSELARDLREALGKNELRLYSQPVVNTDRSVRGHEALLRWQHPERGMVSPGEFIPVAEQSGLIVAIGDWVLRQACQTLAHWASDPERCDWTLAVNLSARQLRLPDFVQRVRSIVTETRAPAALLKLELTESLLLHDVEDTIVKMTDLATDGIRFSLDDFGTGYSSLSYLKRLPLSVLKIDQSFVHDLLTDPNDAIIAHTILQLADSLGLEVVAEGVESQGQMQLLQVMGCKAFQGYLFGRPQPI